MGFDLKKYLKGNVEIEIKGFSGERLLSLACDNSIRLWNIKKTPENIRASISIEDYKKLRILARKTASKIKLKNKRGLPFAIKYISKRKMFFSGTLVFCLILCQLSQYIWQIEIENNKSITDRQILEVCREGKLYLGARKSKIQREDIIRSLKSAYPTISWASITTKGTRVNIDIGESLPQKSTLQKEMPCNIISEHQGIVNEIFTRSGIALVKKGDVINKGDILVSGEVPIFTEGELKGYTYTNADATIKARLMDTIEITLPYTYYKKAKIYEKNSYEIVIFNKKFGIMQNRKELSNDNTEKKAEITQLKLGDSYPLPFWIIKNVYTGYSLKKQTYSKEEAQKLLEYQLTQRIIEEYPFKDDIISTTINFKEKQQSLCLYAEICSLCEIGYKSEITEFKEGVTENETTINPNSQ